MFKKFINWWNKDKIRRQEVDDTLARIESMFEQQKKELDEANEQLAIYRAKEEENQQRYNSTEPWIEVKSAKHDDVKGIQIELDWNDAFIQYLKENGIVGKTEDIAIQKYLGLLYEDLIQRFEQKIVDNSDKQRINDFE